MKTSAALQLGPRRIEMTELEIPALLPGQALFKVEGSGMCGSDYEQYVGAFDGTNLITRYPLVPGHEPVGTIVEITPEAAAAWRVAEGDRVAVEAFGACAVCLPCTRGDYTLCVHKHFYGFTPTDVGCGLWGGYAEYMVLQGNTQLHQISPSLSIEDAVLFNPVGAGFEWVCRVGETRPGDVVVIAGPGQRGLASVIAARESGAATVILAGTARDAARMDIGRKLGADLLVNVDEDDLVQIVREQTDGYGADQFYDMSAFATQPIIDGIKSVRRGGTVVLAGIKGNKAIPNFVSDDIVLDGLTLKGALAVRRPAYRQAIRIIESEKYPALRELHTHTLPITQLERGMQLLGGEHGEYAMHVTIVPTEVA